MKRWVMFAAAALAVGGTAAAEAQDGMMTERRASRFEFGIYAGGSLTSPWYDSRTVTLNGTPEPTENDDEESFSPGYAPVFGTHLTYWLTPLFGLRLHGAYAPMRPPTTDGAFDNAGEREFYVLNSYFYDLNLALRPFIGRDGWYRTVYLFAGGGGLTVDAAGEDRRQCTPYTLAYAACLSYDTEHSTVGQGSVGAGIDLLRLGSSLALFGELAAHIYDSPVHVGDEWVGVITAPRGTTVRIADDRTAVTGRLVIGAKLALGNLFPPPVVAPPPPPPVEVAPPPPPAEPTVSVNNLLVCVIENGTPTNVQAEYNTRTGDTTVAGRRFSEAYPVTGAYAAGATWYINNEPVPFAGRRYVKYGLPRVLGATEVARAGEYQGVGVFTEAGATGTPEVIYVPVRPGCEFQPYQYETKAGGVRGE